MRHLISFVILASIALTGCHSSNSQSRVESSIRSAINHGRPAEEIEQLVLQADDPSHAAAVAAYQILRSHSMPIEIRRNWAYYQDKDVLSTPSVEIYEVINRYKVSVLRVLVPHGVNLNQHPTGMPVVIWGGWAEPPMTPELLAFLLDHGYDPNLNHGLPSPLGFCTQPGQSFLRYDHKYEMLKALLEHGANPNVKRAGQSALHELILDQPENPYRLDMMELLLNAGADVNVRDRQGKTPLDIAMEIKAARPDNPLGPKLIDMFERYGAKRSSDL